MFPEYRLLDQEQNALYRIAVGETCVIILGNIVWISQPIVTPVAQIGQVDAHSIRHFIQCWEYCVR